MLRAIFSSSAAGRSPMAATRSSACAIWVGVYTFATRDRFIGGAGGSAGAAEAGAWWASTSGLDCPTAGAASASSAASMARRA